MASTMAKQLALYIVLYSPIQMAAEPALRRGRQVLRARTDKPGLFAVSRLLDGHGVLVAFNTSTAPIDVNVEVDSASLNFDAVYGVCAPNAAAPGSIALKIPALDYVICAAGAAQ